MNHRSKQVVKFFLFFGVTVLLFWLVYRDQNPQDLIKMLREDVDYTWMWVAIIMGIASHASRALRWQMLAESMGERISFWNSFFGIMIGYFANIAIPRMGEFTRCGVVSKYENVPFSKLLGTVVTERVIDMFVLLSLTLIVVITQFKQVNIFLDGNQDIKASLMSLLHSGWIVVIGIVLLVGGYFLWRLLKRTKLYAKMGNFLSGLKEGLLTVRNVKRKWLFVFYTLFIWLMYYLMFYVCFFCFQFTSHLGPMVGLTVFVLASYGMVAPVQGGIGAWHFMVIAALMIYLPHTEQVETLTKTFAFLTHGSMTLTYIVVGALCFLLMPLYNAARKKKREAGMVPGTIVKESGCKAK